FAVARAQLEADRVEAALVIEPLASITLRQNPSWRIIFNGAQGWKEITGQEGWEIVPALRAETIARLPEAPKMLLAALQDGASVRHRNTAPAKRTAVDPARLPPGILKAAGDGGGLQMFGRRAGEPPPRQSITDMMQRAVKAGFYQAMPDNKIIYAP